MALNVIQRVMDRTHPGPLYTYTSIQVIDAILRLRGRSLGRGALARELGLGDGAVRTLINALKDHELIEVRKEGCVLTAKGNKTYSSLRKSISLPEEVGASPLTVGAHNIAIRVKGHSDGITTGVQERDAAIKEGGTGATILQYNNNLFKMPSGPDDCEKEYPDPIWDWLRLHLKVGQGDTIILGSGTTQLEARRAALAVVRRLLRL